jgi:hypothetical protein
MPKRFTATEKWDDPYFCELSPTGKLVWIYLLDKCDNAGIYDVNIKNLNFAIEADYTLEQILDLVGERIKILNGGSKWFIPKFIEFQYGELNDECYPHRPVIAKLEKYGLLKNKGINSHSNIPSGVLDKEKDKDKDKEKDIPPENEFLEYAKTLPIYHTSMDFQIKAKYQSWVESGWKDGHGKKIKNWRTKLQNTMPYFKKDFSTSKSNDGFYTYKEMMDIVNDNRNSTKQTDFEFVSKDKWKRK